MIPVGRAAKAGIAAAACVAAGAAFLTVATLRDLKPLPVSLDTVAYAAPSPVDSAPRTDRSSRPTPQVLDRRGVALNVTFTDHWNVHDRLALHDVPRFLRNAFVAAEDRRFFRHRGVDWRARIAAVATNVANGRAVRGASTITEQVVRMLTPRPRTVWSRWLEGFEAARLERRFGKDEILEFYLNQVPYASNRRGVLQAARYYFDRELGTLSTKEMLALAVLVRAPSRLDPKRDPRAVDGAIARLADTLVGQGMLAANARGRLDAQPLALADPQLPVRAPHFVGHARAQTQRTAPHAASILTTLDGALQRNLQAMLDARVADLAERGVHDGAALVVEHETFEVLAWVVAGGAAPAGPVTHIDAVTTPRQPGSALKPFLYALALDSGWSAAEIIVDAPLTESASFGLHSYRNYSRRHYGPVTLRDALGNSLNIPAVKTLQQVGAERYLGTLRALGFAGLDAHPDHYGDGIALGTGEVTLLELVGAYSALARGGVFRPLTVLLHDAAPRPAKRVFSVEAATLIGHILSDPQARALEFGTDGVLRFPVQTAVKTGTSSDFRDAWAVGFDDRYTIGVWLGNLDRSPSAGVSGAAGPALLLRSLFAELNRGRRTRPLPLAASLERHEICVPLPRTARADADEAGRAGALGTFMTRAGAGAGGLDPDDALGCRRREEWFAPGTAPGGIEKSAQSPARAPTIELRQPTHGLRLAYDPRVPADAQAFQFVIGGILPHDDVRWTVDGRTFESQGPTWLWPVTRGEHRVAAEVRRNGTQVAAFEEVVFTVK